MDQSTNNKLHQAFRLPDEDIAFQDRLEHFDKLTLTMGLAHLHTREETRRYMLNYLTNMEAMLAVAGLIGKDSLRGRILELIDEERSAQQTTGASEGTPRRTIDDWLDLIHRQLATSATAYAKRDTIGALNAILKVGAQCVGCLEERLGKAIDEGTPALAEAIRKVTEHNTADGAATPPAADD